MWSPLKRLFKAEPAAADSFAQDQDKALYEWLIVQALAQLGKAATPGLLSWWAVALAEATFSTCSVLASDANLPEFESILTDRTAAMRVAAFCSWWLADRTLGDYPEIYTNAESGEIDEVGQMMIRDLRSIASALYPVGEDRLVQKAISFARFNGSVPTPTQQIEAKDSIVALATGEEISPNDNISERFREGIERAIYVTSILVAHRGLPKERLDELARSGRKMAR